MFKKVRKTHFDVQKILMTYLRFLYTKTQFRCVVLNNEYTPGIGNILRCEEKKFTPPPLSFKPLIPFPCKADFPGKKIVLHFPADILYSLSYIIYLYLDYKEQSTFYIPCPT